MQATTLNPQFKRFTGRTRLTLPVENTDADKPTFVGQWRERAKALAYLPTIFSVIWRAGRSFVVAGLALRVVSAVLPLAILGISKIIVDSVTARAAGRAMWPHFWLWVALEVVLAAAGALLGRMNWYVDMVLADRFSHNLSVEIMRHASRLDMAQYEDASFHDKLERARLQATDRVPLISESGLLVQQILTAASFCAGILWFSPPLLAVMAICLLPAFAGESHFAFLGYSLASSQTSKRRKLDYLRFLGASREAAKELKLFSMANTLTNQFRALSNQLFRENKNLWSRRLLVGALLSMVAVCGYYSAFIYVVYKAVSGDISVGTLTLLSGAIAGASASLQHVFSTFSNIADQTLFLKDLDSFFKVKPLLSVSKNPLPVPRPIRTGFRFENVSFRYPGTDRCVLENFNLDIAPGERIALVGANGQGKTTIVKLLTRLYDPTEGRILLDGVDLRQYDAQALFREFSVLFQDFMQYDMEAHENIAVGRIDLVGSEREKMIRMAAQRSGAGAVIDRLPAKMQQMLGRRFEGGVDLSGGEWQKIALARAYLREAQVYVLDEPTAALDARSEFEVFEHFSNLTKGKMALLISHRFSTVRMVDRILVLKDGRIAEQGNHDELIARDGIYASLFELQAASYR